MPKHHKGGSVVEDLDPSPTLRLPSSNKHDSFAAFGMTSHLAPDKRPYTAYDQLRDSIAESLGDFFKPSSTHAEKTAKDTVSKRHTSR